MLIDTAENIEFTIVGISQAEVEGGYIILLENEEIAKRIPLHVGIHEGEYLSMALEEFETPRPLTHQLIFNVLRDLKVQLESVQIYRVYEGILFAKLMIPSGKNQFLEIDARPSDALILAILHNCPLHISSDVVESVGINIDKTSQINEAQDEETEFYGMSIQDLEKELKLILAREEYETASKIRDRINFLKTKKKNGNP